MSSTSSKSPVEAQATLCFAHSPSNSIYLLLPPNSHTHNHTHNCLVYLFARSFHFLSSYFRSHGSATAATVVSAILHDRAGAFNTPSRRRYQGHGRLLSQGKLRVCHVAHMTEPDRRTLEQVSQKAREAETVDMSRQKEASSSEAYTSQHSSK